jgi:hypothetical protein
MVWYICTDVSEEQAAAIFTVTGLSTLKMDGWGCRWRRRKTFWLDIPERHNDYYMHDLH